jgi:vancomycin resistance protein VanW
LLFEAKAFVLRRLRSLRDLRQGRPLKHPFGTDIALAPLAGDIRSPLWIGEIAGPNDRALTAGKIQNIRVAARRLDGVEVPSGAVFSFWAQVGAPTRLRGFVMGRELREGCLVPSIGGGLCQLSNALYAAAVDAGLEIVERHAHSRVVPGSEAAAGRDATVFWNYVDLRLKSRTAFRIEARLSSDELNVAIRTDARRGPAAPLAVPLAVPRPLASDCTMCEQIDCRNHAPEPLSPVRAPVAWLIEPAHPEFALHFAHESKQEDRLFLSSRLFPRGAAWPERSCHESGFDVEAIRRRLAIRRADTGAALQMTLSASDARLARAYARRLPHLITDLVVSQSLLPHLWLDGALQGRRYDILMDRLPYALLHQALDAAHRRHPDSDTLGEYRAPARLVDAEQAAIAGARRIITAHSRLASLHPGRSLVIDWAPARPLAAARGGNCFLFPASALARKGAFALREAIAGLDIVLLIRGRAREGDDFWRNLSVRIVEPAEPLPPLAAVVLPGLIEHRPDALLEALAAHIPVIATNACGLTPRPGLSLVDRDDPVALRQAMLEVLVPVGQPVV